MNFQFFPPLAGSHSGGTIFKGEEKGFTLLEVIIACFIIAVGVVGAYLVFPQIISYTSGAGSQLTAAYLAQEGVEIVRNIRDTNWVNDNDWKTGLTSCPNGCEADYSAASISEPYQQGSFLNFESSSGFYGYNSGSPTQYERKITISEDIDGENNPILKVTVEVFWKNKSVSVQENLYNWHSQ